MIRSLMLTLLSIAIFSCNTQDEPQGVSSVDFDELSKESYEYLKVRQTEAQEKFNLGAYERYDWDQEKMQLVWSDAGVPKVIAESGVQTYVICE